MCCLEKAGLLFYNADNDMQFLLGKERDYGNQDKGAGRGRTVGCH